MQFSPARALAVGLILGSMLAACSRHPSPTAPPPDPGVVAPETTAWNDGGMRPQTARARLRFVGSFVELDANLRPHVVRNVSFYVDSDGDPKDLAARDTIPTGARLVQIRWRTADGSGFVVDHEPSFTVTGAGGPAHEGPLPNGVNILYLRVPEKAGGGRSVTGWIQVGYPPAAWFAGPDPALFPPSSDGDGRAVDVLDWATFTTSPAWPPDGRGYFGPDSFEFVPSRRAPVNRDFDRRTFYEIWGDRIYARNEGDVVHQGATLAFAFGGYDRDSRYAPVVTSSAPTIPPGYESQPDRYAVLIASDPIGSPSGFRFRVPKRDAVGISYPSETTTFPDFDPASVTYYPIVCAYWRADTPGKAYAIAAAVDADRQVQRETEAGLLEIVDRVDAGMGSAGDRLTRRRVLTFLVKASAPAPARGTR